MHHQWIDEQLAVPVTVATIAQRLRDDHGVEVSESTVRRYIATTFTEKRLEDRVTVPRGAVARQFVPRNSRADDAHFMVNQLTDTAYIHGASAVMP